MLSKTVASTLKRFKIFATGLSPLQQNFSTFKSVDATDVSNFKSFLQDGDILEGSEDLAGYNVDWTKKYQGNSKLLLRPDSTEKVSKILKYCNDNNIAVVPQGGNSGLVGGGIPVDDEVILSMSRMNKIYEYDENLGVVTTEAGAVLDELNQYLSKYEVEMPLDLGARGQCQIGGNIATNAGGIRLIKFGPFKSYILGLEAVLANGEVLDMTSKIRKDNTGLDMKQLFIGSEGILGVITKANILATSIDKFKSVVLLKVKDFQKVLQVASVAKSMLGRHLGALEFIDSYGYDVVQRNVSGVVSPFEGENTKDNCYVVIEVCGQEDLSGIIETMYNQLSEQELVQDSIISESEEQFGQIWKLRESIAEGCNKEGLVFKYDVSLPINQFNDLTNSVRERLGKSCYTCGYGHIGDGNIHINSCLYDRSKKSETEKLLEPYIFEYLQKCKGSISAEHGVGVMKAQYLQYSKNKETIGFMQKFKNLFDPKGILNPRKVLPGQ